MNTWKQNPQKEPKGEAEVLPLSYLEALRQYRYKDAICVLKKEVSRKDANLSQQAYEHAIAAHAKDVVVYLLRHHRLKTLSPIGRAVPEIFEILRYVHLEKAPDEAFVVYHEALHSKDAIEKLKMLEKWGYPLDVCDEDGVELKDLLALELKNTKYANDQTGQNALRRDRKVLARLDVLEQSGKLGGTITKKKVIKTIVWVLFFMAIAIVCFCAGYVIATGAIRGIGATKI